ncbi:MAG: ribosome biogenesis GTP-binding protein YihA/YsxC [Proteobacteria bacterium]|nr:ribosome biogenesis GTP-binding protein YihA/YsxC [Pseudomonadota bacterium]MDE3208625.1 YihA family ribosome biogenesis GTP-binding protein [Pseudomonadota bacterium]
MLNGLKFITSINDLYSLPQEGRAEIAFAGRSNAGKSSAINTLANHNRLAFVSKTPGRTQLINYFSLGAHYIVDLPGYGYAKVPEKLRLHWQSIIASYLQNRSVLKGLILIMDARHPLTLLDQQMLDWFAPTGKPVHILLSKADKLSRNQATFTLNKIKTDLSVSFPLITVQLFSSLKRQGIEEACKTIQSWLENSVL